MSRIRCPKRSAITKPAVTSGTAETGGGDFILRLASADRQRIVLVDVMGHGVTAKAWSIAYAAIIRTINQCRPELGAGEFLTQLAAFAWNEQSLEQAMATVLVADFSRDRVTIAAAGHPAPLILGGRSAPHRCRRAATRRSAAADL